MIDDLIEFGAGFDWITPLESIIGDLVNGPSHTFLIPIDASPLTGAQCQKLLKRRGIKTWGVMIVSDTLMMTCKLHQARYAQQLLESEDVPIENPLPTQQARKLPRNAGRDQGSPFSVFDDTFERR